jgi:hypothetical protein
MGSPVRHNGAQKPAAWIDHPPPRQRHATVLDNVRAGEVNPEGREALDACYVTRRELIDTAMDLNDAGLRRIRDATLQAPVRLPNDALPGFDSGDTVLDQRAKLHDTLARTEHDHTGGWCGAGFAAGGEPETKLAKNLRWALPEHARPTRSRRGRRHGHGGITG